MIFSFRRPFIELRPAVPLAATRRDGGNPRTLQDPGPRGHVSARCPGNELHPQPSRNGTERRAVERCRELTIHRCGAARRRSDHQFDFRPRTRKPEPRGRARPATWNRESREKSHLERRELPLSGLGRGSPVQTPKARLCLASFGCHPRSRRNPESIYSLVLLFPCLWLFDSNCT